MKPDELRRLEAVEAFMKDRKRQQIVAPLDSLSVQILQSGRGTTVSVGQGGTGAVTLTGILKGNGTSAFTAISPLAGTKVYYVSDSSGGAVTRKLTFTDGILTAET